LPPPPPPPSPLRTASSSSFATPSPAPLSPPSPSPPPPPPPSSSPPPSSPPQDRSMAGQTTALGVLFCSACGRLISCCHEILLQFGCISAREQQLVSHRRLVLLARPHRLGQRTFRVPMQLLRRAEVARRLGRRRPRGMHAPHRSPPWPARAAVGARPRVRSSARGASSASRHGARLGCELRAQGCTAWAGMRLCETPMYSKSLEIVKDWHTVREHIRKTSPRTTSGPVMNPTLYIQ
jgi:hypothetical protein